MCLSLELNSAVERRLWNKFLLGSKVKKVVYISIRFFFFFYFIVVFVFVVPKCCLHKFIFGVFYKCLAYGIGAKILHY